MLLLDTSQLPPSDRREAFDVAMQESAPCRVEQREPGDEIRARIHLWSYGSAALLQTDASPFRMVRTPRHVRSDAVPGVGIAFQAAGHGEFSQLGHDQVVNGTELMLVDLTAPYAFGCAHGGGSRAFLIPYEQLALPVDVVRRAIPRLAASPLHRLVQAHLQRLADAAPELSGDPGADALGTATVDLVRALVVSAAGDARLGRAVMADSLATRVRSFVGLHLRDPDLTPERIARAHSVSVRQLYKAFAGEGLSLEQWIIDQRLELARTELSSPAGLRRSISATARGCGFASDSHFSRRFRRTYGLTPRDWQRAASRQVS